MASRLPEKAKGALLHTFMSDHDDPLAVTSRSERLEELILRRRLEAFALGSFLSLLPSLLSIALLYFSYRTVVPRWLIDPWFVLALVSVGARMATDARRRIAAAALSDLQREWRRVNIQLFLGAIVYAAALPVMAYYAGHLGIGLLTLVGTVVFVSTLLMHRTAPRAARVHIVLMAASLLLSLYLGVGMHAWVGMTLVVVYAATLLGAVRAQERGFLASALADIERDEAESTVRVLLTDYQEQSSEWLWTVDEKGLLTGVSGGLATSLQVDEDAVDGKPLLDWIQPGEDSALLAANLAAGRAFRDLTVRATVGTELRYWRLSARPLPDGGMRGVVRDVTRDRMTEERVAFMAHFDNLTGLANRYRFNERLAELMEEPARASHVALFCLDLDDFKAVNDARGHLVGDRLLREVGTRLEQEVRGDDLVARLGGDEFAILVESRAGAGALIDRAHRFLAVVREPYEIDGQQYRVSTSIGIARCTLGDCDGQELMRRADLALFAAKAKGRDTLALFEPALDRAARERREIESDLREAIPRGELALYYQPVIDLGSVRTTGYEVLLRWNHPTRGVLAPGEFLEIAEETGLIIPIGEWVIREAIAETASWPSEQRIAINLSPTQVRSPNLLVVVTQALAACQFAAERLEFEITEHVSMREGDAGYTTLLKLREMGAAIALDDFGTGYSSLSYLRRFPFDRIKIDRHFVEDIEASIENQAIVSSITRLADALGMHTTAEGIERRPQLDMLRKLGCHEAQGYLICEPRPAGRLPRVDDNGDLAAAYGSDVVDYRTEVERRKGGGEAA